MRTFPAADAIGLYVSIPFCRSKCTFCNFASDVYAGADHARYVERLGEELRNARHNAERIGAHLPRLVDTIYLGGGTPSILDPVLLRQLFDSIRCEFQLAADAEITMECAPGQIDDATLAAMAECGVNRVSLGVQSFVDREAATTGRLHNRKTALEDIARIRAAGIARISLDLIAGLPHQTLASWRESLDVLTGTGVQHASIYMLEVDDESRLGKEMMSGGARYHAGAVPKDDTIATMFEMASENLQAARLNQYEISNYAVTEQESKHNLKYWTRRPCLGIGLDAHSMLEALAGNSRGTTIRFSYADDLASFMSVENLWQDMDVLTPHAELEEAWFLGLRLAQGVDLQQLNDCFGEAAVARFLPMLAELAQDGLLTMDRHHVALKRRGKLISNEVFGRILEVGDEQFCLTN